MTQPVESNTQARLRLDAEGRIKAGIAPATQGWSTGAEALTLLHSLASDPASAGDALKLLHELQVHQVELDLQHEQMEQNQRELEGALRRHAELYEFAPAGYFTVNPDGRIMDGNPAGARLLGIEWHELGGHRIDSFMTPESRPVLLDLLRRAQQSGASERCVAYSGDGAGALRVLQVVASVAPRTPALLMIIVDTTDRAEESPQA